MGPNFFIWIAIAVTVLSTALGLSGHMEWVWLGYPVALGLAVLNKVRALRRRDQIAPVTVNDPARRVGRIVTGLIVGALTGALFFSVLAVLILGGLHEPYITIAIALAAGAVFCSAYWRASVTRRKRLAQAPRADVPNVN